jgi:hypothetical protein
MGGDRLMTVSEQQQVDQLNQEIKHLTAHDLLPPVHHQLIKYLSSFPVPYPLKPAILMRNDQMTQ